MPDPKLQPTTRKGAASERLLHALAAEFPLMHNRQSFLASNSLAKNISNDKDHKAAAKTLGRLIGGQESDGAIAEILWIRGQDPRINLPATGLISVSVDIVTLREEEWLRSKARNDAEKVDLLSTRGPTLPFDKEPTQEAIVEEIIEKSKVWATEHLVDGRLPILLTDISIVHGSTAFDILVRLSFSNQDMLLRYAREVIQHIPHIRGTQTMIVSKGYGFSGI